MGNKTSASRKTDKVNRRQVLANERIQQPALVTKRIQQRALVTERIQQPGLVTERIQQPGLVTERIQQPGLVTERIQQPGLVTERIQQRALDTERIQQQDAIIEQLKQQNHTAVEDKLVLCQTIDKQRTIIQQLRRTIRTQELARQTEKCTQATQTNKNDVCTQATQTNKNDVYVGNQHAVLHRTPSMYSAQHYHHVIDTWRYIFIERSVHAEPMGKPNNARIQMFTASRRTWFSGPRRIIQPVLPRLQPGEKIYYHASSDGYIKSIIENGIDVSKSTRATDFSCGGGFYVTKNFGKAVEWSKRRAKWDKCRPAVIAFKIDGSLRKEEPHLALKVDSSTNRKWWECVVSHFRNSEMSPDVRKVLADVKFIKGPVANNKYVGFDENPRPFDFTQLCIRDAEYAQRFGSLENIAFVIFGVNKNRS